MKLSRTNRQTRKNQLSRPKWRLLPLEDRIVPANQLLPDLHVLSGNLTGWTITNNVEIRFSTGMANGGAGPFELNGTTTIIDNGNGTKSHVVNQKIYWDDSTTTTRVAGTFTYHAAHGHTHFDDFAVARLRVRPSNQSVGGIVAIGPKTSFCLIDINRYNAALPGSPASGVYSCSTTKQGISVGWNDVYSSGLEGQSIPIAGVPNGDYWLEVEADPQDHILENNEANNVTRIAITISGQSTTGFRVLAATPIGAQKSPVSFVDLNFNMAVDPATFTAADVVFNGPSGAIGGVSVASVSATQFRVNFPTQAAIGTYTMTIGPAISSTTGQLMDQNNNGTGGEALDNFINIFTVTAPRVNMVSPAGTTAAPVSTVRVTYDRDMDSTTFTAADILSFAGPGGANLLGSITGVTPVISGGKSPSFDIGFAAISAPGAYSMVIGADVTDTNGNKVDQDNNGVPNQVTDQYTNNFTIPIAGVYGPDAFGYTAVATPYQTITSTSWTGITYTNTDDESKALSIGTDVFNFYGTNYTGSQLFASTNGLITFGSGSSSYQNDDMSSLTVPAIAALWDDLIIGTGLPQVRYVRRDTNGDAINDQLVVEWNAVYHYDSKVNAMTIQAVLELNTSNRTGKIYLNYPDLDNGNAQSNGGAATVGVRSNTTMNSRLVVSQDSNAHPLVGSNKAMLISTPSVVSIVRGDASPAPDGDVHYIVTFSDGVTGVDAADFVLTTTGMSGAGIHGIDPTADPKVWEVHLDTGYGNGTIRLDVIDNDSIISVAGAKLGGTGLVNGDYKTGQVYSIVQQPPTVQGVNIGDGTSQRSQIDKLQVVFTKIVTFAGAPSAAFQLVGPNGAVTVNVDLSLTTPIQTVAKLTFSGANTEFGSVRDGNYTLTILGSQITTGGVNLDGDGNGSAGGNNTTTFHRLFGDANGDKSIAADDFIAFRLAFGGTNIAFDFDGDGSVSAADFVQFRLRFGGSI